MPMEQTLIQKYSTALIQSLISKIESLKTLDHKLTKGELRELFVSDLLNLFLTDQFGIGSGIIVNQRGRQSKQNDIIIYDKRILPPFIKQSHLCVFPAESVLAVLEIKSNLRKKDILQFEETSKYHYDIIYKPDDSFYQDYNLLKPICAIFGFYGSGVRELNDKIHGKKWLQDNIKNILYLGLLNKYSWINMHSSGWTGHLVDKTNNETKRYIAVMLDNIRTLAEQRINYLNQTHHDWIGLYIRDQRL